MDTSSLDGAGGSYLDNSIERRCQEWQASEYYNSTDSCPCLDDPDAQGQVRRTRREQRFFVFPKLSRPTLQKRHHFQLGVSASATCQRSSDDTTRKIVNTPIWNERCFLCTSDQRKWMTVYSEDIYVYLWTSPVTSGFLSNSSFSSISQE